MQNHEQEYCIGRPLVHPKNIHATTGPEPHRAIAQRDQKSQDHIQRSRAHGRETKVGAQVEECHRWVNAIKP